VTHCIDIILSLEANKKFISTTTMTLTHSKQQEFKFKFNKNFEELKTILNKIEYSYHQLRARDNRTTYYVVRAAWLSLVIVAAGVFSVELYAGLGHTAFTLMNTGVESLSTFLANLI
jgi:hypothetical protein